MVYRAFRTMQIIFIIICKCISKSNVSENHSMYIFPQSYYGIGWKNAQYHCEESFGTSLATIITHNDMTNAKNTFQQGYISWANSVNIFFNQVTFPANGSAWIGLYTDVTMHNNWKWITPSCNSSSESNEYLNNNWALNQPDGKPAYDSLLQRFAAKLRFTIYENRSSLSLGFYDDAINYDDATWMYLCNAPISKYLPPKCTRGLKCWNLQETFLNEHSLNDLVAADNSSNRYDFQPPIAYWNRTLFLVGEKEIHYTSIQLFGNEYHWINKKINLINFRSWNLAQRYAQYGSHLFLYVFAFVDDNTSHPKDYILQINLSDLNLTKYVVPYDSIWDKVNQQLKYYCMVAAINHIYILQQSSIIMVFNTNTGQWHTQTLQQPIILPLSCVMGTDDIIYIVEGGTSYYPVLKTVKIDRLSGALYDGTASSINVCVNAQKYVSSVTALNGKMYFQGCDVESWQTLVFDTKTQKFDNTTIDIFVPNINEIPYYRSSQIISIDDNILMSFYLMNGKYPSQTNLSHSYSVKMHFAVTDLVAINLTETLSSYHVWPSDGFAIKYQITDFTNCTGNGFTHNVSLYNKNPLIKVVITLSKNDNCICDCTEYCYCHECYQQFQLGKSLSPNHNNISKLFFVPTMDNMDAVIYPDLIPITLVRCDISFHKLEKVITNEDPLIAIVFRFTLSTSCHSRAGSHKYHLNIRSPYFNISNKLTVYINSNNSGVDITCNIGISNCHYSDEEGTFVIYYATANVKKANFHIIIESNLIDFRVVSPSNYTLQYYIIPSDVDKKYLYLLLLLVLPAIIIGIIFIYCKKQYNNAYVVNKALVLIIGISNFNDDELFLPGVHQNVIDLKQLWKDKYNYEVLICNSDTLCSTKRTVEAFVDRHMTKIHNLPYKAVIVHIISHGSADGFICSDLKEINIDFICHELATAEENSDHHGLIKLIFNHGCRGTANYSCSSSPQSTESRAVFHSKIHIANSDNYNMPSESNLIIVSGNIVGRVLSDAGHFTQCIVESFAQNADRILKVDFNSLFVEIGNDLSKRTNSAELCNVSGTLRYHEVRFDKCQDEMLLNSDKNDIPTGIPYIELN
eukprot:389183_1